MAYYECALVWMNFCVMITHVSVSVSAWKHSMFSPHCRRSALYGCWVSGTGSWGRRYSTPWSLHLRSQTCAQLLSWRGCWTKGNLRRQNRGILVILNKLCSTCESCFPHSIVIVLYKKEMFILHLNTHIERFHGWYSQTECWVSGGAVRTRSVLTSAGECSRKRQTCSSPRRS